MVEEEGVHNVPTGVDMEKERVQEVINEEVIIEKEDHKFQYLENEDVEIIVIKEPFHQQLEKELLIQHEKDEQTKKSQQEGKML